MRIISGHSRGRKLASPKDQRVRPTTDRIREALFSILGNIEDALVVDGFAGSGALGCEALSRGARRCYFFDVSGESVRLVQENVRRIGGDDRAVVKRSRFVEGLEQYVSEAVDLCFLDPPYGSGLIHPSLLALRDSVHVSEGTLIVVECGRDEEIDTVAGFSLEDERRYGQTRILFLRRLGEDNSFDD